MREANSSSIFQILFLISLTFVPLSLQPSAFSICGVVFTERGLPAAGVTVYGSISEKCCPFKREQTTTDENGKFGLARSGAVIHFWKEGFEPLAVVVTPDMAQVRITLTRAQGDLIVPVCSRAKGGRKLIGWGKDGLHFAVPRDGVKILGGKVDVDYVRYVVQLKGGTSFLELWFGPYAFSLDADDKLFMESMTFAQRNLVSPKGGDIGSLHADAGVIGQDSWGVLKNGLNWRHTGVFGSGAVYRDADSREAQTFDAVINSICAGFR